MLRFVGRPSSWIHSLPRHPLGVGAYRTVPVQALRRFCTSSDDSNKKKPEQPPTPPSAGGGGSDSSSKDSKTPSTKILTVAPFKKRVLGPSGYPTQVVILPMFNEVPFPGLYNTTPHLGLCSRCFVKNRDLQCAWEYVDVYLLLVIICLFLGMS